MARKRNFDGGSVKSLTFAGATAYREQGRHLLGLVAQKAQQSGQERPLALGEGAKAADVQLAVLEELRIIRRVLSRYLPVIAMTGALGVDELASMGRIARMGESGDEADAGDLPEAEPQQQQPSGAVGEPSRAAGEDIPF